jgi:hypothetical protein
MKAVRSWVRTAVVAVVCALVQAAHAATWYVSTNGPDKHFGGTNACVELEPGKWGIIAGDADGDGKITPTDRKIVEQQRGKTEYLSGDLLRYASPCIPLGGRGQAHFFEKTVRFAPDRGKHIVRQLYRQRGHSGLPQIALTAIHRLKPG